MRPAAAVGVLCRPSDANGSIADNPHAGRPAGRRAGRVCDVPAYLYRASGRTFVFTGQPVSILRRDDSGDWARVISDTRTKGWIELRALCG